MSVAAEVSTPFKSYDRPIQQGNNEDDIPSFFRRPASAEPQKSDVPSSKTAANHVLLAFGAGSGDSDIISALREATGQTTNRAGQALVERNLNVQPTITVRPGWPLRVVVHKDLLLAPNGD